MVAGEALQVFQASVENTQEIAVLLRDSDRLWNRVKAALVNPERPEARLGALILAQRAEGVRWHGSTSNPNPSNHIQSLLRRLRGEFSTAKISSSHPSRIVGSGTSHQSQLSPVATPKGGTQTGKQWYQVQIAAYHDGKRWQNPFPA